MFRLCCDSDITHIFFTTPLCTVSHRSTQLKVRKDSPSYSRPFELGRDLFNASLLHKQQFPLSTSHFVVHYLIFATNVCSCKALLLQEPCFLFVLNNLCLAAEASWHWRHRVRVEGRAEAVQQSDHRKRIAC